MNMGYIPKDARWYLAAKKKDLGVFAPIKPLRSHNFMPNGIADELKKRMRK